MLITKKYARRLISQGKATRSGVTTKDEKRYAILTRHDLHRVDHYRVG